MTVVPIYNMVVAPNARTFMQTDLYKRLTGKDPEENEQVVLLIARKQALLSEMRQNGIFKKFNGICIEIYL